MCFCFKKLLNSVRDSHWNHSHGLIHREKKNRDQSKLYSTALCVVSGLSCSICNSSGAQRCITKRDERRCIFCRYFFNSFFHGGGGISNIVNWGEATGIERGKQKRQMSKSWPTPHHFVLVCLAKKSASGKAILLFYSCKHPDWLLYFSDFF